MEDSFYESASPSGYADASDKYKFIANLISKGSPTRVLDIGCGDGGLLRLVKQAAPESEVFGIDISHETVSKACKRGIDARIVDIDCGALPFNEGYFDCVFCGEIIEHLKDTDHLLEEVYRVLGRGGRLILTTPNLGAWFNRISLLFGYQPVFSEVSYKKNYGHVVALEGQLAGHLRMFTYRSLVQMLRDNKFTIEYVKGFGVNTRIGIGRKYKLLFSIMNYICMSPSLCSNILVEASVSKK